MESPQNSLAFPSPELQNAVTDLWTVIHMAAESLNALNEQNMSLKNQLADVSSRTGEESETVQRLMEEATELGETIFLKDEEIVSLNEKLDMMQVLQKNADDLEQNLKNALEEVHHKNNQLVTSSEEILQLNNEISDLKNQIHQMSIDGDSSAELISKLSVEENRVKELNSELNKLRFDYDVLKSEAQVENGKLAKEHEELKHFVNSLNAKNLVLDSALMDERSDNASLKTELQRLTDENTELNNQLADLKNQSAMNENLPSKLSNVENELTETKNSLLISQKQLNDLRIKEIEFTNKIEYLEKSIESKEKAFLDDKNTVQQNMARISSMELLLQQKDKLIEEANITIQNLKNQSSVNDISKVENLEAQIREKDSRLIELKQFESEFHKLRQELADIKAHGEEREKQLKRSSEERIELESRVFSLSSESNKLKREQETTTFTLQTLEAQIKTLQQKLKDAENKAGNIKQVYTIDDAIKESLIYKIEEQLDKINRLIK